MSFVEPFHKAVLHPRVHQTSGQMSFESVVNIDNECCIIQGQAILNLPWEKRDACNRGRGPAWNNDGGI